MEQRLKGERAAMAVCCRFLVSIASLVTVARQAGSRNVSHLTTGCKISLKKGQVLASLMCPCALLFPACALGASNGMRLRPHHCHAEGAVS